MDTSPFPNETDVRASHLLNAQLPRVVTLSGIVSVFILVHPSNAQFPIVIDDNSNVDWFNFSSSKVMEESSVQPENAQFPIEVRLLGKVIDVNAVQPLNATSPIELI